MRFLKKHSYLIFLAACVVAFYFVVTAGSTIISIKFLAILSSILLIWSISHHFFDKSLTWEVIGEYILTIALVILSVVYFLL